MSALRTELYPGYTISRIIKGGWQLAGGHGAVDRRQAIADMLQFVDRGITTFDCADIYTGVESMIGDAIGALAQREGFDADNDIQIHTKLVPDLDKLESITHTDIEAIVDRSLRRLNLERLHLVQFYWWDVTIGDPMYSLSVLKELQRKGKIRYLGCTNWDHSIMQQFVDNDFNMISAQVQYSLLDQRPEGTFSQWCKAHSIKLLCYGVLAGGFLSSSWLGQSDPGYAFENRSLIKYRLIIDEFGGWNLFQQLLKILDQIAKEHQVSLSSIAIRYMLGKPEVAAVIVGARSASHIEHTMAVFNLELSEDNTRAITDVLLQGKGPTGKVYGLERDRQGPHGRIMKYNLNVPPE
jgi:aryl-alcohol dehydrogenase-like predicted oxidoreductase